MHAVKAIVPAAGLSTRMGGPNKLLLPWGETTIVGAVVATLIQCGLDVVVVTGRDAEHVTQAVSPARTVFNARYEEGLGTSIAAGVAACREAGGFLIALGDMPSLRTNVVLALLDAYARAAATSIICPVYADEPERTGHPVLFGSAYRDELMTLSGDMGAKAVLEANSDHLHLVPVGGSLEDMDLPG